MRMPIALTALIAAAGACIPTSTAAAQATFYLTILHNNDGESQIIDAGTGLSNFGGIARFKTLVDNLRAQALTYPAGPEEKGSVLISSGDNFLAGPEFAVSLNRPAPLPFYDSIGMALIGYDACTIGNHEFDFGPDVFQRFVEGFSPITPFISANLNYAGEPGLNALVGSRLFKSVVINVTTSSGTQQVGVVGATTTDLPFISTVRGVVVNPLVTAIQAEVDALLASGVNKIILSSHLQGLTSEFNLAPQLRGVDVIIGGGGGELLANPSNLLIPGDTAFATALGGTGYPRLATDLDSRQVPVVTTRGDYRYVGRLIVGFDAAGNVVSFNDPANGPQRVSSIAPDAVAADPTMLALVTNPVTAGVAQLQASVIGQREVALDGLTSSVRSVETNLGNLCADAMLFNAVNRAAQFNAPIADVALQNGGGMRNDSILGVGNFTEFDTFSVLPFANFVSVVPNVPPAQFKEILENCVANVAGTPGGGSGTGRFAQIAGLRFVWNSTQQRQILNASGQVTQVGSRVREVILNDGRVIVANGVVVPGAPSVNVATIDFLARGGDQYPFRGLPFVNLGISYQQSLDTFITDGLGGGVSARRYPAGGERRIIRVDSGGPILFCKADYSLDGVLDSADIFAFLNDWFAHAGGAGPADMDVNGTVETADIFSFLNAWFAGC